MTSSNFFLKGIFCNEELLIFILDLTLLRITKLHQLFHNFLALDQLL